MPACARISGAVLLFLAACSPTYVAPEEGQPRANATYEDSDRAWARLLRRGNELGTVAESSRSVGRLVVEVQTGAQRYVTCGTVEGSGPRWSGPWIQSARRSGSEVEVSARATIRLKDARQQKKMARVEARYAVDLERRGLEGRSVWGESWRWSTGGSATHRDSVRNVDVTCTETGELEEGLLAPLR